MATTSDVIYISDGDSDDSYPSPILEVKPEHSHQDSFDASLLLSSPESTATTRIKRARMAPTAVIGYDTPIRSRRRRTSGARDDVMKPITPSATIQSSMNPSLVFDIVTSLGTNDPGVGIAALRSIVVLGKEYPSNLLFDELIDRVMGVEAIAYADAASIYASLVFVFDKAASCSCDLSFPHQWAPLANALHDVATKPMSDERWRRNLLVVQFLIYCCKKDLDMCRERYKHDPSTPWLYRTRLFQLLNQGEDDESSSASKRVSAQRKTQNGWIMQAISHTLMLWQRVYDDKSFASDSEASKAKLEAEDACVATVRLIEMLYLCTDQVQNVLQRLQAGLLELSRETRAVFSQALQLPDLKTRLATTCIGLTNKSRSKEHEWSECNAVGRIIRSINSEFTTVPASDSKAAEGYSRSHFESFVAGPSRNDFSRLLQDIAKLQKTQD